MFGKASIFLQLGFADPVIMRLQEGPGWIGVLATMMHVDGSAKQNARIAESANHLAVLSWRRVQMAKFREEVEEELELDDDSDIDPSGEEEVEAPKKKAKVIKAKAKADADGEEEEPVKKPRKKNVVSIATKKASKTPPTASKQVETKSPGRAKEMKTTEKSATLVKKSTKAKSKKPKVLRWIKDNWKFPFGPESVAGKIFAKAAEGISEKALLKLLFETKKIGGEKFTEVYARWVWYCLKSGKYPAAKAVWKVSSKDGLFKISPAREAA
jgi:hypothetical protein